MSNEQKTKSMRTAPLYVRFCLSIASLFLIGLCFALPAFGEDATAAIDPDTGLPITTQQNSTDVCIIARVTGVPAENVVVNGDFSAVTTIAWDETYSALALENVSTLCDAVSKDSSLHVTLAISPVLLESWLATDTDAGGTLRSSLDKALQTNRLELVTLGYGDPDFSFLYSIGCADDIGAHYAFARSALSVPTSNGTVPLSLDLPEGCASLLVQNSIAWTAVDSSLVSPLNADSAFGIYTSYNNRDLSIISVDSTQGTAFIGEDTTQVLGVLSSFLASHPDGAYAGIVDIGTSEGAGERLVASLKSIKGDSRFSLKTGSEAIATIDGKGLIPSLADVRARETISAVDEGYIREVTNARRNTNALRDVLYSSSATYDTALQLSLLSEYGNWKEGTDTGIAYANASTQAALSMLSGIHIYVEPMVLAGTHGSIPIVLINDTDAAYTVNLDFIEGDNLVVSDGGETESNEIIIYSGQNYIQIPVELTAQRSTLGIAVHVGDFTITQNTISITTSHIDQITIVVCAVLGILGLILLISRYFRRKNPLNQVDSEQNGKDDISEEHVS
ncbi:MAG: hypothetical protein HGA54_04930 [Actinobacteria bacterium]|nr:hypothetical protein [Actinomycetota bacterium]